MHFCNAVLDKNAKVTGKIVKNIPKIHWVPSKAVKISVVMPNGRTVEGFAEPEIKNVKQNDIVQFERIGFARYNGNNLFYFAHK